MVNYAKIYAELLHMRYLSWSKILQSLPDPHYNIINIATSGVWKLKTAAATIFKSHSNTASRIHSYQAKLTSSSKKPWPQPLPKGIWRFLISLASTCIIECLLPWNKLVRGASFYREIGSRYSQCLIFDHRYFWHLTLNLVSNILIKVDIIFALIYQSWSIECSIWLSKKYKAASPLVKGDSMLMQIKEITVEGWDRS